MRWGVPAFTHSLSAMYNPIAFFFFKLITRDTAERGRRGVAPPQSPFPHKNPVYEAPCTKHRVFRVPLLVSSGDGVRCRFVAIFFNPVTHFRESNPPPLPVYPLTRGVSFQPGTPSEFLTTPHRAAPFFLNDRGRSSLYSKVRVNLFR